MENVILMEVYWREFQLCQRFHHDLMSLVILYQKLKFHKAESTFGICSGQIHMMLSNPSNVCLKILIV